MFKRIKKWIFKHALAEAIDTARIDVDTVADNRGQKTILVTVEIFGFTLLKEKFVLG